MTENLPTRLVVVVSHPIQHFVPFYRALAARPEIDLTVLYASRIGLEPYFDKEMNTVISWDMDLLAGYKHVFLRRAERIMSARPLKVNNPGVGTELSRQNPDVVLIYGYNQITALKTLLWCRRNAVHAMLIGDSNIEDYRSNLKKRIKKLVIPFILKKFSAFLYVSQRNIEYYLYYGVKKENMFSSPFTIDEDVYLKKIKNKKEIRRLIRKKLSIFDKEIVILNVGKLSLRKRSEDVLKIAEKLSIDNPEIKIRFVIVGDGKLMRRMRDTVTKKNLPVILAGFVNVDKLPDYYFGSDILLHTSSKDPCSLVIPEAVCAGLPVVSSDVVGAIGPTGVARPDENAIPVRCGDIDGFARSVRKLAENEELRRSMAARSIEIYAKMNMRTSVDGVLAAIGYCLSLKSA